MQLPTPVTDLTRIRQLAQEREPEQDAFRTFLRNRDPEATDQLVHALNATISPRIDCTQCGNCCRSLMIQVSEEEVTRAAIAKEMDKDCFKEQYLEESSGGQLIVNKIPCHFLEGTRCSIYENRFESCREFPPLHLPGFTRRLFALMFHYGSCPIIFNVMESLKTATGFRKDV